VVERSRADFDDAFRAEYPGIVRVVAPIVGSVPDAEGLVQDAFVKAFARWGRISRYDRPGAWIQRVAIRDAVRFSRRGSGPATTATANADPVAGVADQIDLQRALLTLSGRQRACIVLHHLADWPVSDVADALGCAEATVRVHLHRGRQALATTLRPEPQETTDGR